MNSKTDDTFNRRSIMLMLGSVALFAANTLLIRAIALHTPAADGWVAILFRGGVGMLVVLALFGFGRGLQLNRLFRGRLITVRGIIGALSTIAF